MSVSQIGTAMLHGVVVLSVLSLVLGDISPVIIPNIASSNSSGEVVPRIQGVCYFGRVPSARCMFRCFMKGSTSFCDEALCLCRTEDHQEVENNLTAIHAAFAEQPPTMQPFIPLPDNETAFNETDPTRHRITFFIFDLSRLFGVPEENATKVLDTSSHIIPKDIVRSAQIWTVPHILAIAILTLLTVLVVLEVLHCCRRPNHKHHFQTVLSPPTLEKVYISEKQ